MSAQNRIGAAVADINATIAECRGFARTLESVSWESLSAASAIGRAIDAVDLIGSLAALSDRLSQGIDDITHARALLSEERYTDHLLAHGWTERAIVIRRESGVKHVDGVCSPCGRWSWPVHGNIKKLTHAPSGLVACGGRPAADVLSNMSESLGEISGVERDMMGAAHDDVQAFVVRISVLRDAPDWSSEVER